MNLMEPNNTNSTSNNNYNNNNNLSKPSSSSSSFERRVRPQKAAAVNCPRCDSINTKFCYYNNYSLSQPRYFCKTCRRYWTEGGTLRNIPVGGGSRKNKRSSSSFSSSSSFTSVDGGSKKLPDLVVPSASTSVLSQNPRIQHDQYGQDLNLGFPSNFKTASEFLQVPSFDATRNPNSSTSDLLNGIITSRGTTNSFMPILIPDHNSVYTNPPPGQLMIPLPEFKIPSLSFSLDGIGNGVGYGNNLHESNSGRLLFPFEDLKTDISTTHDDDHDDDDQGMQSKDQNCDSNVFWNGMMGGGSW